MKSSKKRNLSRSSLRRGDMVMVLSGGNQKKRPLKGKTGKILRFVRGNPQLAVVEGLNMMTRHQRARGPGKPAAKISREAPMHVSRLMYYVEKIKAPVRIKYNVLADGNKVRGYTDAKTGAFTQLAE